MGSDLQEKRAASDWICSPLLIMPEQGEVHSFMSPVFALLWDSADEAAAIAESLDASGWDVVDRQAAQHRLRPLLYCRALAGGWDVPSVCMQRWQTSYRRSARRALDQKVALTRIARCFGKGGVTAAVLKGGAFLWSGAIDPAVRPMRDLDLLVRPDDAERASALLAEIGFVGDPRSLPSDKHLPALTDGKVVVELHLHLFDRQDDAGAAREAAFIRRAWERKVAAAVPGMHALCPTDTLLHLILHAVLDHQFNNGPLLFVDMPALVQSGAIDWALLWQEAEQIEAIRACQLALALGERCCGLTVDWQGHAPTDLDETELDTARRLMLVDMAYRSAVGWPAQFLRLPPHRWPAQVSAMIRRRSAARQAGGAERNGEPGLGAALSYAIGAEGRARIADSVRLSFWLRR